jgi:ubiquinone/menaquinone biosynthesis C-methylase UbiE
MEAEEYARLDETEHRHWWFAAAHALVIATLRARPSGIASPILDAGCGTGGLLARLEARFPGRPLVGVDIAAAALAHARAKTRATLARASVAALPFPDRAFGAVVSVDVLCHRAVDPDAALREFHRVLVSGGTLTLNMPAHRWLHAVHDDRVHNRSRYALKEIRAMLAAAGFETLDAHHWNSLLFPALLLQRKVLAPLARGPRRSDVAPVSAPLDLCLRGAMAVERGLLRAGLRLPFGGSILAVARKPAS